MAKQKNAADLAQRKESLTKLKYSLLAIVAGFLVGAIVLLISGHNPLTAYEALFKNVFSKPKYLAQAIISATPLILTGLSVTFAFKTGLFNIGAEGQYIVGSMCSLLVGLFVPAPPIILPILAILAGALGGGLWGAIVGWLKAKKGISEVITSIMFNWVAYYLSNFITMIPGIRQPDSESTRQIPVAAQTYIPWFKKALGPLTRVNWGIVVAIVALVVISFILRKTTLGFRLQAVGYNRHAARFNGISVTQSIMASMAISGILAGLAGATQVLGVQFQVNLLANLEMYGFNGLSVAFIGNITPIGTLLGGLFYGALSYGGSKLTLLNIPSDVVDIMIGTIVYFIAITAAVRVAFESLGKKLRKGGKE